MREETYEGCSIISTPIPTKFYKYVVNGIIQVDSESYTMNILSENLNIPHDEWEHMSEENADKIFIKYAKVYIESLKAKSQSSS